MFASSPRSVSSIQYLTSSLAVLGLFFFDFNLFNCFILLIGYFLYSGIGVSMMMHRYYTHNSFEFRNPVVKWIFTLFALMAGRGGIIGWVYIHRLHHAFSDTEKDPHHTSLNFKGIFFPKYSQFTAKIDLRIVRDLLSKEFIFIDKYYNLLIVAWCALLATIGLEFLYFGWIVPVALTHILLNSFLYFGHTHGYKNHNHRDNSTNLWPYGFLLWGEGWHNNHHKNPRNWNLREKWWELDIVGSVIRMVKK